MVSAELTTAMLLRLAARAGTWELSLAPAAAATTTIIALSLLSLLPPLESGKKGDFSLPAAFQCLPHGDGTNLTGTQQYSAWSTLF